MTIKDWQPLHDRMIASQRHLRKLNENTKELGYTKNWPKRYQSGDTDTNKNQPDLTTIRKIKQQAQAGKRKGQLRHKIKKL